MGGDNKLKYGVFHEEATEIAPAAGTAAEETNPHVVHI